MLQAVTRLAGALLISFTLALIGARAIMPALPYGGELIIVSYTSNASHLYLLDAARAKFVPIYREEHLGLSNPRWSAQGAQLMVDVRDWREPSTDANFALLDLHTQTLTRVTPVDAEAALTVFDIPLLGFAVSDGMIWTRVFGGGGARPLDAFTAWADRVRVALVETIDADSFRLIVSDVDVNGSSSVQRSWVYPRTWSSAPVFAPDGEQMLVWRANAERSGYQLYAYDLISGAETAMGDTPIWLSGAVAWSPDGVQVAYVSVLDDSARTQIIRVTRADGTDATREVYRSTVPGGITQVGWSPDGARLAFTFSSDQGGWLCVLILANESVVCPQHERITFTLQNFAWRPR